MAALTSKRIGRPALFAAVLLAAAVLRLYDLELKPVHHDEGINGLFFLRLIRERTYVYDPANYHGPTLYYVAVLTTGYWRFLFGEDGINTVAIRLAPALLGILTIWLVVALQRRVGAVAALTAAALLAVSPGAVYFSRYFIHETLLVFFTLALVAAAVRLSESNRVRDAVPAALAAAFLVATKETAVITLAVLVLAFISTRLWLRINARIVGGSPPRAAPSPLWSKLRITVAIAAFAAFVLAFVTLYSTFFLNFPQGVYAALTSMSYWTRTAQTAHIYPWQTYFTWLIKADPVLLVAAAAATPVVLLRGTPFGVFSAFWAWGTVAAYSLIGYKTPWLALNFLLPFALAAGHGVDVAWRFAGSARGRVVIAVLVAAMACFSLQRAVELNFFRYDDDSQPYVYAHTRRDFLKLIDAVHRLAQASGTGKATGICISAPEYWPIPWYLRQYTKVGYPARVEPGDATLLVASEAQRQEIDEKFGSQFRLTGAYPLRPGVTLLLYVRSTQEITGQMTVQGGSTAGHSR